MEYVREIFAQYDTQSIRVYQAYNPIIAKEALAQQTFGEHFSRNRMTWIKPSFLWMMYRSGWATKKNQECILALDLHREKFQELLQEAVLTSPGPTERSQWEKNFAQATVYCQWDPDKNSNGDPIPRAAIQLGIKGRALEDFLHNAILRISDLTPSVRKWNEMRKNRKLTPEMLPFEKIYPISDPALRKKLRMQ